MPSSSQLILTVAPADSRAALPAGVMPAHMAYRVGGGPHLFRASMTVPVRGGLMAVDDSGFDGLGEPTPFCHEVMRELTARSFTGVFCNFEHRPFPVLGRIVSELGELMHKRSLPLYVTEDYARFSATARVMVSSALSGGSLRQRLSEAAEQYGPDRAVLAVERVCQDFFLPSPTGQGIPLAHEELTRRMEELAPSVFFSDELCARYFTYMSPQNGAHFILFDDALSIRKKLMIARSFGITEAMMAYPQVSDLLDDILPGALT